jgi:hypothetical protein
VDSITGKIADGEEDNFYGEEGKIVLEDGSTISRNNDIFLGEDRSAHYNWSTGGQVVLEKDTMTLQKGTIVVNAASTGIVSGDTAIIAEGAKLQIPAGKEFVLSAGDVASNDAKLVVSGTIEVAGKITFDAPFSPFIGSSYVENVSVKKGGTILLNYGSTLTVPESGSPIEVVGPSSGSAIFTWASPTADGASIEIGEGTSIFTIKGGTVTLASAYEVYGSDTIVVAAGATLALGSIALTGQDDKGSRGGPSTVTINPAPSGGTPVAGKITITSGTTFYDTDGTTDISSAVVAGTYKWDTTNGGEWLKQTP